MSSLRHTNPPRQGRATRALARVGAGLALLGFALPGGAQASEPPVVTMGASGMQVTSADGRHGLRLGALVQAGVLGAPGDPQGTVQSGFSVRRARFDIRLQTAGVFHLRVQPEVAGDRLTLLDGSIDWAPEPWFVARVGKQKVPIGFEQAQTPGAIAFLERGLSTALVPRRDVGVSVHADAAERRVRLSVGVFNGAADTAAANDNAPDESFEVAARVAVYPWAASEGTLRRVQAGAAATVGAGGDDGAHPLTAGYRTAGRATFFRYATETAAADGAATRLTAFVHAPLGPVLVYGDAVRNAAPARSEAADAATLAHVAWLAGASFVVGGEPTESGVVPTRDAGPGGHGAFELRLRATGLHIDRDAFDGFAADGSFERATEVGAGVTWWASRGVRWLNDLYHTGLKAPDGGTDRDEWVLWSAWQVAL